jgi:CheY-like chemotaxis protein
VEDARELRERVVRLLKKEGYQVYGAASGEQALMVLSVAPRPTLMLADLISPDLEVPLLVSALNEDDRLATLPVVVLGSSDAKSTKGSTRLKNLIDFDDLLKVVEGMCARRT